MESTMTTKKTTAKSKRTTKDTASKSTASKNTVSKNTAEFGTKVRNRVIGMQKRSLDFQENAFDRTYDIVASAQERTEDRINGWLDNSERVPSEAKNIVKEWIGFRQDARKGYRAAVSKSFDLSQKWFDGMKKSA